MPQEKNFTPSPDPRRATIAAAVALLPSPESDALRSAAVFQHGSLLLKLYAPTGTDRQTPHTRDELYLVVSGTGIFVNGDARHPFGPGDALFVPAGAEHRFEDFSDDFRTWVVFYGPEGGETAGATA